MPLPDRYVLKPASIPAYFDAILDAQPPERFSYRFLENLGFASTNDRLLSGLLKELGLGLLPVSWSTGNESTVHTTGLRFPIHFLAVDRAGHGRIRH
jgi:hypothetical protein